MRHIVVFGLFVAFVLATAYQVGAHEPASSKRSRALLHELVQVGAEASRVCGSTLTVIGDCVVRCGVGNLIDSTCLERCITPSVLRAAKKIGESSRRTEEIAREARRLRYPNPQKARTAISDEDKAKLLEFCTEVPQSSLCKELR